MCGVFGVSMPTGSGVDAAGLAAMGLFALQHRGQEPAGIAVSDHREIFLYKDLGMISQVLDDRRLPSIPSGIAIAHCRYSTTRPRNWRTPPPTLPVRPAR